MYQLHFLFLLFENIYSNGILSVFCNHISFFLSSFVCLLLPVVTFTFFLRVCISKCSCVCVCVYACVCQGSKQFFLSMALWKRTNSVSSLVKFNSEFTQSFFVFSYIYTACFLKFEYEI